MKSTFKKTLALFIMAVSVGQGQTNHANNSQKQYLTLVENQKTPFLNSDGEVLIVEGVAWERHYGEKEYVLTPTMKSVSDYNQRIMLGQLGMAMFKGPFEIEKSAKEKNT